MKQLYEFQKEAVEKAIHYDKFLLALDMGLGKTFTSLHIASRQDIKRIMIIVQGSKINDWVEECKNVYPDKTIITLKSKAELTKKLKDIKNSDDYILIVKHHSIWRWEKELKSILTEDLFVILDECQIAKSHNSSIGKFMFKLSKKINKLLLLSGDPFSNGYHETYNLLRLLGYDLNYNEFKYHFCILSQMKHSRGFFFDVIVGTRNDELLLELIHAPSYFAKTDDHIDLPNQNIIDIHLDLDKPKEYTKTRTHKTYKDIYSFESPASLMIALRQLASGFIRDEVKISSHKKEALKDLLESTDKDFLIFYNFNNEYHDIMSIAKDLKIKAYTLNGNLNDLATDDNIGRKLYVSQIKAGSTGHNFQQFNNTIYYSPTTSGSDYKQSLKRTHRIGQDKPCFYYRFITNKTLESKMYKCLEQAQDFTEKMFDEYLKNSV